MNEWLDHVGHAQCWRESGPGGQAHCHRMAVTWEGEVGERERSNLGERKRMSEPEKAASRVLMLPDSTLGTAVAGDTVAAGYDAIVAPRGARRGIFRVRKVLKNTRCQEHHPERPNTSTITRYERVRNPILGRWASGRSVSRSLISAGSFSL